MLRRMFRLVSRTRFNVLAFSNHSGLDGHDGCVNSVAFSEDGKLMASSGDDRVVLVYRVCDALSPTANLVDCLHGYGHESNVFGLAFDRAGRKLLSCAHDNTAQCYDIEHASASGTMLYETFDGHGGGVHRAEWIDVVSPHAKDGRQFVTGSEDSTICLWDIRTSEREDGRRIPVERLCCGSPVQGLAVHPSLPWYIAASTETGSVVVYDLRKVVGPQMSRRGLFGEDAELLRSGCASHTFLGTRFHRTVPLASYDLSCLYSRPFGPTCFQRHPSGRVLTANGHAMVRQAAGVYRCVPVRRPWEAEETEETTKNSIVWPPRPAWMQGVCSTDGWAHLCQTASHRHSAAKVFNMARDQAVCAGITAAPRDCMGGSLLVLSLRGRAPVLLPFDTVNWSPILVCQSDSYSSRVTLKSSAIVRVDGRNEERLGLTGAHQCDWMVAAGSESMAIHLWPIPRAITRQAPLALPGSASQVELTRGGEETAAPRSRDSCVAAISEAIDAVVSEAAAEVFDDPTLAAIEAALRLRKHTPPGQACNLLPSPAETRAATVGSTLLTPAGFDLSPSSWMPESLLPGCLGFPASIAENAPVDESGSSTAAAAGAATPAVEEPTVLSTQPLLSPEGLLRAWLDPRGTVAATDSRPTRWIVSDEQLLVGHESMANFIVQHPTLPVLASCGVESRVRLWGPWAGIEHGGPLKALVPSSKMASRGAGEDGFPWWGCGGAAREEPVRPEQRPSGGADLLLSIKRGEQATPPCTERDIIRQSLLVGTAVAPPVGCVAAARSRGPATNGSLARRVPSGVRCFVNREAGVTSTPCMRGVRQRASQSMRRWVSSFKDDDLSTVTDEQARIPGLEDLGPLPLADLCLVGVATDSAFLVRPEVELMAKSQGRSVQAVEAANAYFEALSPRIQRRLGPNVSLRPLAVEPLPAAHERNPPEAYKAITLLAGLQSSDRVREATSVVCHTSEDDQSTISSFLAFSRQSSIAEDASVFVWEADGLFDLIHPIVRRPGRHRVVVPGSTLKDLGRGFRSDGMEARWTLLFPSSAAEVNMHSFLARTWTTLEVLRVRHNAGIPISAGSGDDSMDVFEQMQHPFSEGMSDGQESGEGESESGEDELESGEGELEPDESEAGEDEGEDASDASRCYDSASRDLSPHCLGVVAPAAGIAAAHVVETGKILHEAETAEAASVCKRERSHEVPRAGKSAAMIPLEVVASADFGRLRDVWQAVPPLPEGGTHCAALRCWVSPRPIDVPLLARTTSSLGFFNAYAGAALPPRQHAVSHDDDGFSRPTTTMFNDKRWLLPLRIAFYNRWTREDAELDEIAADAERLQYTWDPSDPDFQMARAFGAHA